MVVEEVLSTVVVTFETTTITTTIPNVSSYTRTEIQRMWYTPNEYLSMKVTRIKDISSLVKKKKREQQQQQKTKKQKKTTTISTRQGKKAKEDVDYDVDSSSCYCCCGLGLLTPQDRQKQLDRINRSRMVVLEFEQTKIDNVKESLIATAYIESTKRCQMEARRRAEKLQQELQLQEGEEEERELLVQQQDRCIGSGGLDGDDHHQLQHGNNSATCRASLSATTIATSTKSLLSPSSFSSSSSLSSKVQPLVTTTRAVGVVLPVVGRVPIERRSL